MFRSLAESFGSGGMATRRTECLPAADVLTRGDDLVIRVELPGIDPDHDLEITVEDNMLHIRGERQETQEAPGSANRCRDEDAFREPQLSPYALPAPSWTLCGGVALWHRELPG